MSSLRSVREIRASLAQTPAQFSAAVAANPEDQADPAPDALTARDATPPTTQPHIPKLTTLAARNTTECTPNPVSLPSTPAQPSPASMHSPRAQAAGSPSATLQHKASPRLSTSARPSTIATQASRMSFSGRSAAPTPRPGSPLTNSPGASSVGGGPPLAMLSRQGTVRRQGVWGDSHRFLGHASPTLAGVRRAGGGLAPYALQALQPCSNDGFDIGQQRGSAAASPRVDLEGPGEARRAADYSRATLLQMLDAEEEGAPDPDTAARRLERMPTVAANNPWRANVLGIKGSLDLHKKRLKERAEVYAALASWSEGVMLHRAPQLLAATEGDVEHVDAEQLEIEERLTDSTLRPNPRGMGVQLRAYWNATVQQEVELRFNKMREQWDADMAAEAEELQELRVACKEFRQMARDYKDQLSSLSIKHELLLRQRQSSSSTQHSHQSNLQEALAAAQIEAAEAKAEAQAANEALAKLVAAGTERAGATPHKEIPTFGRALPEQPKKATSPSNNATGGPGADKLAAEVAHLKELLSAGFHERAQLQSEIAAATELCTSLSAEKDAALKQADKSKVSLCLGFSLSPNITRGDMEVVSS
ncbi:hypothetical protein V8C86DRAFT_1327174 [Haematococcus lacustris]